MSTTNQKMIFLLVIDVLLLTGTVESDSKIQKKHTCDCICSDKFIDASYRGNTPCQVLLEFEKVLKAVKEEIERRTDFVNNVSRLTLIMEEQDISITKLQAQMKNLPNARIVGVDVEEDYIQGDSNREIRIKEEKELVNNVSTLIAKVEEVENLTSQFQEELKSERRLRRHLEVDLNETRFSMKMLDDKLLNVTLPMDNMNKTFFEDHLRKLYYKVDGVVYKNETEKLDERLHQIESDLMDVNNMTLKLADELNFATILNTLNQTIMEKLAEEEYRLGSLENKTKKLNQLEELQDQMANVLNKTTKLDELENLQDQLTILLNVTDQMQTRAIDLWIDIQNVRNTTAELEKKLYDQSVMTNKTIASSQQELSRKLQTLNESLSSLKNESLSEQVSQRNLQRDLQSLSTDVASSKNKVLNLSLQLENKMKDTTIELEKKLYDQSITTNKTLASAQREITWKLLSLNQSLSRVKGEAQDSQRNLQNDLRILSADVAVSKNKLRYLTVQSKKLMKGMSCDLPLVNDEHLLMALQKDSHGVETLDFGCRPIGRYVIEGGRVSPKCKDGFWDRDPPACTRLKDEAEIISYNSAEKLTDLIPTILIEPDNVDKYFGLMATDDSGHLIVYPNTTFKLHCLFPENQLGPPTWFAFKLFRNPASVVSSRNVKHRSTVEFDAISSRDSGLYICQTLYHKTHSIKIVVKAVECPEFQVDSKQRKAMMYRYDGGGPRVLGTKAEFLCEDGSSISAMCLANGTWSRPAPTVKECSPNNPKVWGCDHYYLDGTDDPIRRFRYSERKIEFRCSGSRRLVGTASTKCINNTWTPSVFPKCK